MASETIRKLHWESLGCGDAAFHAALFTAEPTQLSPFRIVLHRHDFFEMLYVTTGTGDHPVLSSSGAGRNVPLVSGDLLFIRPDDCHSFTVPPGGRLHWINIAFPQTAWDAFRTAAGLTAGDWDGAALPPITHLAGEERHMACQRAFNGALDRFQRWRIGDTETTPSALNLCRFLAEAVGLLTVASATSKEENNCAGEPPWLRRVCRTFADNPRYIAEGLPRLTALSGVTYAHLARSLKAARGRTPTQYVNDLRLARAALLLTTTPLTIVEIAGDCGFGQLSYFYRQFQQRFGLPPRAYRQAARRSVAP